MAKDMHTSTPSSMWANVLEALTAEFGGEDGTQTVTKFCVIRAKGDEDILQVAQRELETLEKRLAPLGKAQNVNFLIGCGEVVVYDEGRSADLWFTVTVLPESEKPKPVEVPGAKK